MEKSCQLLELRFGRIIWCNSQLQTHESARQYSAFYIKWIQIFREKFENTSTNILRLQQDPPVKLIHSSLRLHPQPPVVFKAPQVCIRVTPPVRKWLNIGGVWHGVYNHRKSNAKLNCLVQFRAMRLELSVISKRRVN